MRHKITRHPVVGVIEKNFHDEIRDSAKRRFARCRVDRRNRRRQSDELPWRYTVRKRSLECTLAYSIHRNRYVIGFRPPGTIRERDLWESLVDGFAHQAVASSRS